MTLSTDATSDALPNALWPANVTLVCDTWVVYSPDSSFSSQPCSPGPSGGRQLVSVVGCADGIGPELCCSSQQMPDLMLSNKRARLEAGHVNRSLQGYARVEGPAGKSAQLDLVATPSPIQENLKSFLPASASWNPAAPRKSPAYICGSSSAADDSVLPTAVSYISSDSILKAYVCMAPADPCAGNSSAAAIDQRTSSSLSTWHHRELPTTRSVSSQLPPSEQPQQPTLSHANHTAYTFNLATLCPSLPAGGAHAGVTQLPSDALTVSVSYAADYSHPPISSAASHQQLGPTTAASCTTATTTATAAAAAALLGCWQQPTVAPALFPFTCTGASLPAVTVVSASAPLQPACLPAAPCGLPGGWPAGLHTVAALGHLYSRAAALPPAPQHAALLGMGLGSGLQPNGQMGVTGEQQRCPSQIPVATSQLRPQLQSQLQALSLPLQPLLTPRLSFVSNTLQPQPQPAALQLQVVPQLQTAQLQTAQAAQTQHLTLALAQPLPQPHSRQRQHSQQQNAPAGAKRRRQAAQPSQPSQQNPPLKEQQQQQQQQQGPFRRIRPPSPVPPSAPLTPLLPTAVGPEDWILHAVRVLGMGEPDTTRLALHCWRRVVGLPQLHHACRLWPSMDGGRNVYATACLWISIKLEEKRRAAPGGTVLAHLALTTPAALCSAELALMNWLSWRPYEGYRPDESHLLVYM